MSHARLSCLREATTLHERSNSEVVSANVAKYATLFIRAKMEKIVVMYLKQRRRLQIKCYGGIVKPNNVKSVKPW